LARLRALLRRCSTSNDLIFRCSDLELSLRGRRVTRAGCDVTQSQREFDLLEYLLRHKNAHVTRDMLAGGDDDQARGLAEGRPQFRAPD